MSCATVSKITGLYKIFSIIYTSGIDGRLSRWYINPTEAMTRQATKGKGMQIIKNQVSKVEAAKIEHVKLLNKELAYSEDLQNKEEIANIRANIAKLDKMIADAA